MARRIRGQRFGKTERSLRLTIPVEHPFDVTRYQIYFQIDSVALFEIFQVCYGKRMRNQVDGKGVVSH